MLEKLRAMPADDRAVRSAEIIERVRRLDAWEEASTVLVFYPLKSEPDVRGLLEACGTRFVLPKVDGERLRLFEYGGLETLQRSKFGMLEPDAGACAEVAVRDVDLVVVPGLAFDPETGVRLGRGGGFYDRLLGDGDFQAQTVGVCFDFQLVAGLAAEAHDRRVGAVVV